MVKKILLCLFLLLPSTLMALPDSCTNPSEYTVDKRCYVTKEQKQQKPFSAMVALIDNEDYIYCTGILIKHNDKLYVYTAKHCLLKADIYDDVFRVRLQNGEVREAKIRWYGDFDYINFTNLLGQEVELYYKSDGDWIIAKLDTNDGPYTNLTDNLKIGKGKYGLTYDANVVGYGALKIMSDAEIEDFRLSYVMFLRNLVGVYDFYEYGVINNSVETSFIDVDTFIHEFINKDIYKEFFENTDLKFSSCGYTSTGMVDGCQVWKGDSGGGIFDKNGNLMGIMTRGYSVIGGKNHIGAGMQVKDTSVNFQPSPKRKVKTEAKKLLQDVKDKFNQE